MDGTWVTRVRQVDVAIVGAGPTGLFAAYYAGFRGLSTVVIDALPEPGGQVTAMYPEKQIYDVAGFPMIRGRDLVANLVRQAEPFNPEYLLGVRAEALSYVDEKPVLALSDGTTLHCGAVLITGGLGSFTARPLPAAEAFTGEGLVYFVPHLDDLAGHHVVIVGGGDSAFDWALSLHPVAKSVTMVHRRDKFRAHAGTVAKVQELPVEIIVNAEVTEIHGTGRVSGAEVLARGAEPRLLPADTVVAALGFTADLGPLAEWGLTLDKRHIVVDTKMATNQPRIFAAGDIAEYPGKVRLIAVGFGEAATAVNNAAIVIDPSAHLFPGHSSDNG
jgi:thioredoxin reductase